MTDQPTRQSIGTRVRNFATFFGAIRECAAAAEAGRRPSNAALKAAGFQAEMFDGRRGF